MPIFTNPEAFNNEVMWEWMLAQELARNFEPAESVARELLARYQQQNGTPLGHAGTRTVLGRILVRREKFAEAEEVLRPAYQARNDRAPDDWLTHITRSVLGGALVGAGKLAEAEPLLREAYRGLTASFDLSREDEPRPTEAAEWLAGLEEKRGHTDRAAQWRQRGRGFNFAVRAQRLLDDKEYVRAAEGFEEATRLDPALESVWNALGWLRATASDPTARNGRAAVAAALKACELTAYKNAAYIDTLAAAYAESGDFDRAVEHQQNALQQGKLSDRERAGYEARLALYRERRPFHQPSR